MLIKIEAQAQATTAAKVRVVFSQLEARSRYSAAMVVTRSRKTAAHDMLKSH
jgi:hypothetical protein